MQTSTGHTLKLNNGHLDIEGDIDTMDRIPEVEIRAFCAENGVRCTWEPSTTTSYRVVPVEPVDIENVVGRLAVIVVDVQNDFLPGGALAVPNGDRVVEPIKRLIAKLPTTTPVILSRDWHPATTKHFKAGGGMWPAHCVQATTGAEFADGLRLLGETGIVVSKGMDPNDDGGYSAFTGVEIDDEDNARTPLDELLKDMGVGTVIVCGLATDYCVKATVLDARKLGYATMLFMPGCAAVNVKPEDGMLAVDEMRAAGALLLE